MGKIKNMIKVVSGSPQFRINEVLDNTAPLYTYYGQTELESDLVNLQVDTSDSKQIRTLDKVNIVNEGDVLFSLISGKATIVRDIHQGYLFTQNYVKLILNDEIDAKYLIYLLNENTSIKRQFKVGLQGSMVLKYTIRQVRELELPKIVSIEKQRIIGEIYFNQLRLQALKKRVVALENTIVIEKLRGINN
ncbi:hypothetical protein [Liquorilactobacillus hordei]|uniref:Type I restriction enzyme, methylase subunit n=1 Tax=Liquorilactobacillus hordei DSM 19519 TaxID=1423759 RepID=A0A0R1MJL3_9LACO|nr:hypothetical protein [Liquorilactobacillus hordei]KRL08124.1 type I restriction enzyme, methylase subunit [Liquorilactobacillus hordei DSM 19519]QYH51797.1 restriction endonuclease subunit M [Liquorilactobacillus hordei DSM 19519]